MQGRDFTLLQILNQYYYVYFQIDENLIPFERKGPLNTPPIKKYHAPDGDYIDTTNKFDKV